MKAQLAISMIVRRFSLFAAVPLVAGCLANPDGEELVGDVEEDATAMRFYDCRASSNETRSLLRFELGLGKTTARVTDVSREPDAPDTGKLDSSYVPTASYAGTVRFGGYKRLYANVEDVASVGLLVSKELRSNASRGVAWLRTSGGGGGGQMRFNCASMPRAFTVNLTRPARFFCETEQLACEGDTCLRDLFARESGDEATLSLTYLDDFGHATKVRKEPLGASRTFSRTKTKVTATWDDAKLDLRYQAGVTYRGTITAFDNAPEKVVCSDLAMFDE